MMAARQAELVEAFKEIDADGSGYLSVEELGELFKSSGYSFTREEVQEIFNDVDTSGDGKISLDEFISAMDSQPPSVHDEAVLRQVFKDIDRDGNGTIDASELNLFFQKLGEKISPAQIERIMKEIDSDGSQTINYEEFLRIFFE